jgi:hypothetical protein
MQSAIAFIKTHAIALGSALLTLIFIVLAVIAIYSDAVVTRMNRVISDTGASSIQGLIGTAKNPDLIAEEKRKGENFEAEFKKTLAEAERINKRDPIMTGVFPKPPDVTARHKFVEIYNEKLAALPQPLDAGTAPTPDDIADEAVQVAEELAIKSEEDKELLVSGAKPDADRTPTAPPPPPPAFGGDGLIGDVAAPGGHGGLGRGGFGRGGAAGTQFQTGPGTPPADPKYDPVLRARMKKARDIRCYIDELTFHKSPIATATGDPPKTDQMWYAQVGLWVQEDVVRAIKELNDAAAQRATQADPSLEPCVEHVPVKRVVSMRVRGYQAAKPVEFPAMPTLDAREGPIKSFTDSKCNEQFDVVQFTLTVIVDPRDVQRLIDQICRTNFYRCIDVDYDQVNRVAEENAGYVYGAAPVVRLQLAFEGFFSRDAYRVKGDKEGEYVPMMPKEVIDEIAGTAGNPQP